MITAAWLAFAVLVGGLVYSNPTDYWQNLGNSIIGASFFLPPFALFYWLQKWIRQSSRGI